MKVTNIWSELKIIKNGIETTVSVPVSIQLNGTERATTNAFYATLTWQRY